MTRVLEQSVRDGGVEVKRATKWTALGVAVLLLIGVMMLAVACGGGEETTTTAASTPATTAPPATQTTATTAPAQTTTTAAGGPVAGGIMKHITSAGPQDVGFWPKMGPTDEGPIFPSVERLCEYTPDRKLVPFLAKTFTEDPAGLTMSCELNQGILFHDGSELTAEVAVWNYNMGINGKKLQFADAIDSIEVTGKYTFVIHLKRWDNQLIHSFGWVPMFSKDAWDKAGADDAAREAWAMDHCVGTGPFVMKEFVRDQSITWVKFDNYWQKGLPLMDGIDYKIIPDATTAAQAMQAGQGDIWQNADSQSRYEMAQKGFIDKTAWAGFIYHLMPNTVDPASPCAKLEVREAIEYAINKEEMTGALGYGIDKPVYLVEPETEWGGDAFAVKRTYDPAKAKELLTAAGYADGCPIDILAVAQTGGSNAYAEAIKGYLEAAGFIVNLDIADPGRFYGSVFGTGWKDLALMFSGMDPNALISCNRWWSPTPMTNLVSFQRPPEFTQMFLDANAAKDEAGQIAGTAAIVKLMNEQALMIPLFVSLNGLVIAPYVHTDYPDEGFIRWDWANTWMDAH
jgi:peptide/nickel transport system substrate-binding protein